MPTTRFHAATAMVAQPTTPAREEHAWEGRRRTAMMPMSAPMTLAIRRWAARTPTTQHRATTEAYARPATFVREELARAGRRSIAAIPINARRIPAMRLWDANMPTTARPVTIRIHAPPTLAFPPPAAPTPPTTILARTGPPAPSAISVPAESVSPDRNRTATTGTPARSILATAAWDA